MKKLSILFAVVIVLQIVLGFFIYVQFDTWSDRGTFGDMFGAINTLFSGLAFAGIIIAIFLQSKELELQRKELELTRAELHRSSDAQKDQAITMLKAAEISAIAAKISCYTQLMAKHQQLPDGTSAGAALNKELEDLKKM